MFKKVNKLKNIIIETNAGVQLLVKEFMQADLNGELMIKNKIQNDFLKNK